MTTRRVQILGWSLIWSGLLLFGYVGWQLFVTDWINHGVQREAQAELRETIVERQPPGRRPVLPSEPPDSTTPIVYHYPEDAPEHGESFAFIRIPSIDVDRVVFGGVDVATLRSGPGHMPWTPLPGQPGNAVISGHRTTYGAPFHNLDLLEPGDRIEVETTIGIHVYEVREMEVVLPNDIWVTDPRPGGWLTLTTCHPKFSARQRLVIWAEMVEGPNMEYIELSASAEET